MKYRQLIFLLPFSFNLFSQTSFDLGYSFGANSTFSKSIESNDKIWGYYTPPFPFTWNNQWTLGWGTQKNKLFAIFEGGSLGVNWYSRSYTDKYPFSDKPNMGNEDKSNMSISTGVKGHVQKNTNLLKLSLLYKHTWYEKNKFNHKSIVGFGYLKTRVENTSANIGMSYYDDTLGWVSSGFVMDKYEYLRNQNLYFILGYQFTYRINNRLNWNTQIVYNQGAFKMIRFHTFRYFNESISGYSEHDEVWSYTRLSYISFLTGITYNLKKNQKIIDKSIVLLKKK